MMTMIASILRVQSQSTPPAGGWRYLQNDWTFSGHPLMSVWSFVAVAMVLMIVIAGLWAWRTYRFDQLRSKPIMIFHHLAREIGITPWDEWLLFLIGRHQDLPTPLTLLLSRGTFDHYTDRYLQTLPPKRRNHVTGRIQRLSRYLFSQEAKQTLESDS